METGTATPPASLQWSKIPKVDSLIVVHIDFRESHDRLMKVSRHDLLFGYRFTLQ
jgi:hypothetical protein